MCLNESYLQLYEEYFYFVWIKNWIGILEAFHHAYEDGKSQNYGPLKLF